MLIYVARTVCAVLILLGMLRQQPQLTGPQPHPPEVAHTAAHSVESALAANAERNAEGQQPLHRVYRVTAYCDRGLTAAGVPSGYGQCAAPADIPFGARVYIPELERTFIVTDRTAKRFRHNTVDLFMSSRPTCKQFGCQYLECEITLPAEPVRYGSARLRKDTLALAAG